MAAAADHNLSAQAIRTALSYVRHDEVRFPELSSWRHSLHLLFNNRCTSAPKLSTQTAPYVSPDTLFSFPH